ncbi:MAG: eukaryotic-like serine/threonine-protein kinase, partial [Thermoanaerobaculia bacterium]|nr:eukaryotic-like serine/threonine-protein kinase [Thermoanaerobaculia bacterium]
FGPFTLDPAQGILSAASREILLGGKAFETLVFLVENAGRVVSKGELIDRVWPDSHVGENNLAQHISLVRKTLAAVDPKTEYVQTMARRGYRFAAVVEISAEVATLTEPPQTRYARSGDVNIAYQVIGDGPIDLVFVMGWVSHLEMFWVEPSFARFLKRLSGFARLIVFDKRGTGLSDRVPLSQLPSLEVRMDDVRAVMAAAGSRRAVLMGVSEGGPLTALFTATYPQLVAGVIMIGAYARRLWAPDYPWGPTAEQREAFIIALERDWGGPLGIEDRAPSLANDPDFRRWWATYLRMGASPGAAAALTRMNAEVDIRHVLPTIHVPTLVIHRTGDRCLRIEEGRFLAERIPGARMVELPGDDHLPFAGDQNSILAAVERFIAELRDTPEPTSVLATCLFVRTDSGNERLPALDAEARREIEWFHGRKFAQVTDALVATFDGPVRAIRCACAIRDAAQRAGVRLAAALHTGECDIDGETISGTTVQIGALLSEAAAAGDVLVSNTVRDLVAGSGIAFASRGHANLGARLGEWSLFEVETPER